MFWKLHFLIYLNFLFVQQPQTGSSASGKDQVWNGRTLKLVVEDTFDGQLNTGIWEHEVSLWGGGVSGPLTVGLCGIWSIG